ncbi:hypothetical protein HD554DRAFT_2040489 [Boletus coccyginus]|nr:hypothetical protein HD554DRAFT_2040489 [Boletus coccyginus]
MGGGRGLSGNPFRLGGGIWVSLTEKLLSSCFQHAEPGSNARTLYPVLCTRTTQTMSSCTLPVMSNGLLYGFMGRDRTRIDVTQSPKLGYGSIAPREHRCFYPVLDRIPEAFATAIASESSDRMEHIGKRFIIVSPEMGPLSTFQIDLYDDMGLGEVTLFSKFQPTRHDRMSMLFEQERSIGSFEERVLVPSAGAVEWAIIHPGLMIAAHRSRDPCSHTPTRDLSLAHRMIKLSRGLGTTLPLPVSGTGTRRARIPRNGRRRGFITRQE